jgi:hypothetical protein
LQFRIKDDLFIVALIYLKRLFFGLKEKVSQLHILRLLESSPISLDRLSTSRTTKLTDRITNMSARLDRNAPIYINIGVTFGQYFPSEKKPVKRPGSVADTHSSSTCKMESQCDCCDFHKYTAKPKSPNTTP